MEDDAIWYDEDDEDDEEDEDGGDEGGFPPLPLDPSFHLFYLLSFPLHVGS